MKHWAVKYLWYERESYYKRLNEPELDINWRKVGDFIGYVMIAILLYIVIPYILS